MKKMNKRGFTLIEMLAVIAIIAILVAIIIPVISTSANKAKAATNAANLRSCKAELITAIASGELEVSENDTDLTDEAKANCSDATLYKKSDGWEKESVSTTDDLKVTYDPDTGDVEFEYDDLTIEEWADGTDEEGSGSNDS